MDENAMRSDQRPARVTKRVVNYNDGYSSSASSDEKVLNVLKDSSNVRSRSRAPQPTTKANAVAANPDASNEEEEEATTAVVNDQMTDYERFVANRDAFARGEPIVKQAYLNRSSIVITKSQSTKRPAPHVTVEQPPRLRKDSPHPLSSEKENIDVNSSHVKKKSRSVMSTTSSVESVDFDGQEDEADRRYESVETLLNVSSARPRRQAAARAFNTLSKIFFIIPSQI
jgi:hypothetical protein